MSSSMRIKMQLRYAREPELVALRFNPVFDFQGIVKQALHAFVMNEPFQVDIPDKPFYIKKPLSIYINLDDVEDKDVIDSLKSSCMPNTAFIRNVMLRSVRGDLLSVYNDATLKKLCFKEFGL